MDKLPDGSEILVNDEDINDINNHLCPRQPCSQKKPRERSVESTGIISMPTKFIDTSKPLPNEPQWKEYICKCCGKRYKIDIKKASW